MSGRRAGLFALRPGANRHQGEIAAFIAALMAWSGQPTEPPVEHSGPQPKGHVETQLTSDGLIWTPYGSPSREVSDAIRAGWPADLWTDAARVSYLEADKWDPTAERNTLSQAGGRCNVPIGRINGVPIVSEDSIGLFQVNVCAWDYTREQMLDPRTNARVGYDIYRQQGWGAWVLTSQTLGLV